MIFFFFFKENRVTLRFKAIYGRRTLLASIVLPDQVFKLNDET